MPPPGYSQVMYAEGNVGMEVYFYLNTDGSETINGAEMIIRSGPPSKGAVHVGLHFLNTDGSITRDVTRYGPDGMIK